jgi:hypothetical protein
VIALLGESAKARRVKGEVIAGEKNTLSIMREPDVDDVVFGA